MFSPDLNVLTQSNVCNTRSERIVIILKEKTAQNTEE